MYKLNPIIKIGGVPVGLPTVLKIDEGSHIPFDETNSDYQAYLKWLSEGNEPLPADE